MSEIILWRSEERRCWRCSKCLSRDSPAVHKEEPQWSRGGRRGWRSGAVMDRPEPPFLTHPSGGGEGFQKESLRRREGWKVFQFVFYFWPSNSILICNTLNSCYPSTVCFAMMVIGRWFPCLDFQVFLSYFISLSCWVWGVRKLLWVSGSRAKLTITTTLCGHRNKPQMNKSDPM